MTYLDKTDQEIIALLEGHTDQEILGAMTTDMLPGSISSINDIFMEIMEMAETTN